MGNADKSDGRGQVAANMAIAGLMAAAILAVFIFSPTEQTMGDAQRILYVHVAVAWSGLCAFLVTAGTALGYLTRRNLAWDHWSQAAAEVGWLCCGLTLVTGSLWAKAAWGTWWTWDPRLTTTFVLWAVYSGYLLLRAALEDPHRQARLAAVLAILAAMDLPLVVLATRWFRGIHPASPEMEPSMRAVLLVSIVAFSALFAMLLARRRAQLLIAGAIANLEERLEIRRSFGDAKDSA
jgi:heme exporter protein C